MKRARHFVTLATIGLLAANLVSFERPSAPVAANETSRIATQAAPSLRLSLGPPRAQALLFGRFFRRVGKAFRRVTGAIGRGFRKIGGAIGKGFKAVGKAVGKGFRAVGKGIAKAAKGVGKALWKAAKFVGKGVVWVAKKTWEGVKAVGKALLAPFKAIYKAVKKFIQRNGPKIAKFMKKFASKFLDKIMKAVKVMVPEIGQVYEMIKDAIRVAKTIVDAIRNPKEIIERGKAFAVEKLTDLAMTPLTPLLKKAFALIVGAAIKLAKHIATTPLAAMIGGAIASVTFGIGAITIPLVKLGLDKLFDFIIDKIKELVANLLFKGTRGLLKKFIVKPLINAAYNGIVSFIKKAFPKLVGAVKKAANKVGRAADKVGGVLDAVSK